VTAEEVVEFNGVSFHRYLMRKDLDPPADCSAVRQPVPRVSSADVERVVTRDFGSAAAAPILAILDGYGGHNSHREPNRVRLAALKLAAGNRARLSELIEQAGLDYRDILAAAEYPAYFGASGLADESERARLIDADWRQYREWLFLPGSRSGPGAQQGAGPAGTGSVRQ
jgi:hypothetical protein